MAEPILIGVTGGIGAGKSTAMELLAEQGVAVFSADAAVHGLYAGGELTDELVKRWGERVLGADGTPDRAVVAGIVFDDPAERRWLEAIVHPLVAREWLRFVAVHRSLDPPPEFIAAEVPLLFEAGLDAGYDATIAISAPLETRLTRIGTRAHGASHGEARASAQLDDAEKSARADFAFENTGSRDELGAWLGGVLEALRGRAGR